MLAVQQACLGLWRLQRSCPRDGLMRTHRAHALPPEPGCLTSDWSRPGLQLRAIDGVRIYGPPPSAQHGRASLAAFNVEGIHPTDISTIMDTMGVAVRSGHLCTQPLHHELGIASSVRASAYIYNTPSEIDDMAVALKDAIKFLQ